MGGREGALAEQRSAIDRPANALRYPSAETLLMKEIGEVK